MDLPELNRLLSERAEAVCTELLSAGKRVNHVWLVGSVRNEPGDSMNVELEGRAAGLWFDHATSEGGDLLSLVQHNQGHTSVGPAAKWARKYLNLPDDHNGATVFDPLKFGFKRDNQWLHGSACWPYHDAAGNIVAYVVRFDFPDGSKDVLPLRLDAGSDPTDTANWHWKGWRKPEPVPLFNAHLLARHPERPVLIVEGEKTAVAAGRIFPDHVATTWQGGTSRVERADLTALRGRNITLWPDHDQAGLRAMRFLHVALPGSRLIHLPDTLPPKWDLADPEVPELPIAGIFAAVAPPPVTKPEPKTPAILFDPQRGAWWTPNRNGGWSSLDREAAKLMLVVNGADAFKDESGASAVDRTLLDIRINSTVVYAGSVAGRPAGIMGSKNKTILVTNPAELLPAALGSCDRLLDFLWQLMGGDSPETDAQLTRLLLWLKFRRQSIAQNRWRHGQALCLIGPADCGKSFLQSKIITAILTGRATKCFRYLSGKTDFNGDHFEAEHLMIDDETTKRDMDSRRSFGSNLKAMLFSENQSCHPKNRQAIPIAPIWAISACFNDEPENLQALPPMEPSLLDKILLLRCSPAKPKLTGGRTDRWDEFEDILNEIPQLAHYVDNLTVPPELHETRCGFTAYQHPALMAELDATTPESSLDEIIQATLFNGVLPCTIWTGTASDLETALLATDRRRDAERLITSSSRMGVYLARLAKQFPNRYQCRRSKLARKWTICAADATD